MDQVPAYAWITTQPELLGHLPLDIGTISFDVTNVAVLQLAKEIQVYAYISLHGLDQTFQRGYYEIYTESDDGKMKFSCYMDVANVNDSVINSDNMWLPFGAGIKKKVFITLHGADGSKGLKPKKSMKKNDTGSMKKHCNEDIFAEAFITGYKVKQI